MAFAAFAAPAAPPPANQPIPREPMRLAHALAETEGRLASAIDTWIANGTRAGPPAAAVTLEALYDQRISRLLAREELLSRLTLPRLSPSLRARVTDDVVARRELWRLTPTANPAALRTGPPAPAGELLAAYRKAARRFRVSWQVLAAVNYVESAFGRLRSASSAGAQGPMQFLPSTWRRYGLGGDIRDPHDAILGAANYLDASGASRSLRRALAAYNHSPLYVDAVLRYARRMQAERRAFYAFYSRQVIVRTGSGDIRLTGPGR